VLESLAIEAIRDVQTAVQAFQQHFEKQELRSATEKLREALLVGEFLPELRTLPLERKRKVLLFFQKSIQLQNALDGRDYALATRILEETDGLRQMAVDFDAAPSLAALEAARQGLRLALQKARMALQEGDQVLFQKHLTEAGRIWPNHPEITTLSSEGFRQADEMALTLKELEGLVARRDFRRIDEQSARFLVAVQSASPEKQAQLREILEQSREVEGALRLASELHQQGNPAGAWEKVYLLSGKLPEENRLSAAAAEYASRAAAFVGAIQTARKLEEQSQLGPSVAWYLKAQKIHPTSDLVRLSLESLCTSLLQKEKGLPEKTP
jgi:hypothetical protein